MYDFGTTDAHSNSISFGDLGDLDGLTVSSWAFNITVNTFPGGTRTIFSKKIDGASASAGWIINVTGAGALVLAQSDGVTQGAAASGDGFLVVSVPATIVVTWNGTTFKAFKDAGTPASVGLTQEPIANTDAVTVGNEGANGNGIAVRIAHVMYWNVALTDDEARSYHAGIIPRANALKFWAPGWTDPGIELVGQATATKNGTVTIVEDKLITVPTYPRTGPRNRLDSTLIRSVTDKLDLQDGDNFDVEDPSGEIVETQSDGTVWTKKFPPFTRRTKWTPTP